MSRGDGSVFLRGRIWWVAYSFRGKLYQESSRSTDEKAARKLLRARLRKVDKPNFVDPNRELRYTIRDMKDLLETSYANNGHKSIATMRSCFKHIEKHFEFDRVADIDEVEIDKFIENRLATKMQRSTVNRLLAYLRHGFRMMFEKRMISRVPVIKLLDGERVRQGFISAGDLSALLEAIPDTDTRDLVEFLYASGWRSKEAMQFRWSWLDGNMIRLPAEYSKNKTPRFMPVVGSLCEVIERRKAKRRLDCEFVFHRNGKPIKFFRDSFKTAAKNIGYAGTLPHDMRRSAIRNFRRAGLSQQEGMALSGHRTPSVYARYSIISEEDLTESMQRVEEHLRREKENRRVVPMKERTA